METYCLKWNDFNSNIQTEFKNLRVSSNNFLSDLNLICVQDGTCFKAHRIVLAVSSQFFWNILRETEESDQLPRGATTDVILEYSSKEIGWILDFIYNGQVQVSKENLAEFFSAARELGIKGLIQDLKTNQNSILVRALQKKRKHSFQDHHDNSSNQHENGLRLDEENSSNEGSSMEEEEQQLEKITDSSEKTFHYEPAMHSKTGELRVRATDPRPCPKCGKIYRSAHTLRTHLEDKHTQCPGYRCVLCGTVAKSRNSLHSHMSRQHRGISTKDLPVLPMPAPFDPVLAAKLLKQNNNQQYFHDNNEQCEAAGQNKNATSSSGSAILDTYLQFIAENSSNYFRQEISD